MTFALVNINILWKKRFPVWGVSVGFEDLKRLKLWQKVVFIANWVLVELNNSGPLIETRQALPSGHLLPPTLT